MTQVVRNRLQLVVIFFTLSTTVFGIPRSIPAQGPQKPAAKRPFREFRENVSLPVDSNLLKRFGTAKDLLADERWSEAIAILQELSQTDNKGLVQVQPGTVGGVATYLNVATRCNVLMSQVSAKGLQNYRQKIDPQAKRWFENWQRTRDETELLRITRLAFLSSYGDDALLALGETAWERGDFSTARQWWEQLVPLPDNVDPKDYPTVLRYPDARLDQPTILARIILCSILDREWRRAEDELRLFSQKYPTAEGWIAGRTGRLGEILQLELDASRDWPTVTFAAEVETFGMSSSRFRAIPESLDVGALRWARPLSPSLMPRPVEGFPFQSEPLSYHPVVYDNFVLTNDADTIRAWNILTGEPAWPSDQDDPASIYPTMAEEKSPIPDKIGVGIPEYTMTIAEGRLYARMGSPVTSPSNLPQRDLESDLVCLDLTQQGKLLWRLPARKLLDGSWRFEGTPVVVSGRAFVTICRRHPQLELTVLCLDALDGQLLWQRPVGGFRTSVDESHNRVSHLLLTAGGGRIFMTSDAGAIVALDAVDGRFEWAISYESRSDESPTALSDPAQKGLLPAMYYRGLLIVAPNDSDSAYCIEADSGRMRWQYSYVANNAQDIPDSLRRELQTTQRRENQWRHLLGVATGGSSGRLIVSGKSLMAINLDSGVKVWQTPRTSFGRGLLAGDEILLPGRATVEICSQQTGQIIRTVPLKTPDSMQQGGNLTLAHGMLLIAQPNRLSAYCEFSQLKERIERELTLHPDNSNLLIQLADLEATEGSTDAAERALQNLLRHLEHDHPNYRIIQQKLAKLWRDAGQSELDKSHLLEAKEFWLNSLSITDEPAKRIELIFNLARTEVDHPKHVISRLQTILDDDRLAALPHGATTAGQVAAAEISRLIEQHGREVYDDIETASANELETLKVNSTSDRLQNFIQKFPHSRGIRSAREWLAQSYQSERKIPEAFAILDEIRQNAWDDQAFVQSTLTTIELLQEADHDHAATNFWESLDRFQPSFEVVFAGMPRTLGDVLAGRQKLINEFQAPRQMSLERTWVYELPSISQVIFPDNPPPSLKYSSVLVCSKHSQLSNTWTWRCLDTRTGQIRWDESSTSPVQIARWTPVQLLIGTSNGWQAREAETGRRVWTNENPLLPATPTFAIQSTEFGDELAWPTLFDAERGFQLIDPNSGQFVSRIKPPGRIHPQFAIGSPGYLGISEQVKIRPAKGEGSKGDGSSIRKRTDNSLVAFFQTGKPTRTWCATTASPRDPWTIQEISNGGEPWLQTPFGSTDRIIGLTCEQHLEGLEVTAGRNEERSPRTNISDTEDRSEIVEFLRRPRPASAIARYDDLSQDLIQLHSNSRSGVDEKKLGGSANRWEYRNFAIGQAAPFAWGQHDQLLVVSDGSLLMSFNPANGHRKWSVGLADFPIQSPPQQICILGNTVFATSQGWLRGISTSNGKGLVEHFLGEAAPQWKTTVAWKAPQKSESTSQSTKHRSVDLQEGILAIWPQRPANSAGTTMLLCDAVSGEVTQRLRLDSEPRKLVIDREGKGIVWTQKSLTGLQPLSY